MQCVVWLLPETAMVYIAERLSGEAEGALSCSRVWGQHSLAGGLLRPANAVEPSIGYPVKKIFIPIELTVSSGQVAKPYPRG